MTATTDDIQVLAVKCGEAAARAAGGETGAYDVLAKIVDSAGGAEVEGDVASGGRHAVYHITRSLLEQARPDVEIPEPTDHHPDRDVAVCVGVGKALAKGEEERAEHQIDQLAAKTFSNRTKRQQGVIHYARYVLLSFRLQRAELQSQSPAFGH